jgi:predicted RNA-binding Zn-ribbon protein involved in translation (DUF1610 family)
MSQLSVFRPCDVDGEPPTLSFATFAARIRSLQLYDVVSRARLEHHNQSCPACGRATVEPIETGRPLLNRNGAVVPRSARLAGFSCNACGNSWFV